MRPSSRHTCDDGFALPIAVGVGVIMILIATTMVIRSNQSQIASISQRSSNKSLAAAETGVANFLAFFNQSRQLARTSLTGKSVANWQSLRDEIRGLPGCSNYADNEILNTLVSRAGDDIDQVPIEIRDGGTVQGRYFLESYSTLPTASDPQFGKLTVVGSADASSSSASRIEVEFPIQQSALTPTSLVDSSPSCGNLATSIPVQSSNILPFDDDTTLLQKVQNNVTDVASVSDADITIPLDCTTQYPSAGLPRSVDTSADVFTYTINGDLNLSLGECIAVKDNKTVFIAVNGNIRGGEGAFFVGENSSLFLISNGSVVLDGTGSVSPVDYKGSDNLTTLPRFPFHVYLTGADNDISSFSGADGELSISTNAEIDVRPIPIMAYAPFGSVSLRLNNSASDRSYEGLVWAKNFDVGPAADKFIPSSDPLRSLAPAVTPSIPPFWRDSLDVSDNSRFFQTRIQPINSWRKMGETP
ncbi:MAG: hypothetical protein AAGB01_05955 [Cyanobacteria bacterium P01_F01_bin.42]